jgi:CheY-like chemotaxis protein/anti-sigma regulatory factor (Ser/Thr protein kinase)
MTHILIVEDSPTQAEQLQGLLAEAGYQTKLARDGLEALQSLSVAQPDLLLVDYMMPGMDGLQLIETVRINYPRVPAILVAARGSEDVAAEALQRGAAGYIPKRRLNTDLLRTVQKLLSASSSGRQNQLLAESWAVSENQFILKSNPDLLAPLVAFVRDKMTQLQVADESTIIRICVGLTEALDNALYHGNFELSSDLRDGDGAAWRDGIRQRRHESPYQDRKIFVTSHITRDEARFTIRDEGRGFDSRMLPTDPDPANLERSSGRGIILMRAFLDEVTFDATGNQVTLVKRRPS